MREQITVLEALQQIDMELNELETHLKEYPDKISALENEIKSSKEILESLISQKDELIKLRSGFENEISQNQENIKKSEEKLFEIKTHKEYQALQKEITETKRLNAELEDKLLVEMEKIENLEAEINQKTEQLEKKESENREKIDEYNMRKKRKFRHWTLKYCPYMKRS